MEEEEDIILADLDDEELSSKCLMTFTTVSKKRSKKG